MILVLAGGVGSASQPGGPPPLEDRVSDGRRKTFPGGSTESTEEGENGTHRGTVALLAAETLFARALMQLLVQLGYHVLRARDSAEVAELYAGAAPDLILIDLAIPSEADLQTIARTRQDFPLTKVIVLCRTHLPVGHGVHRVFRKPFDTEELLAEIRASTDAKVGEICGTA